MMACAGSRCLRVHGQCSMLFATLFYLQSFMCLGENISWGDAAKRRNPLMRRDAAAKNTFGDDRGVHLKNLENQLSDIFSDLEPNTSSNLEESDKSSSSKIMSGGANDQADKRTTKPLPEQGGAMQSDEELRELRKSEETIYARVKDPAAFHTIFSLEDAMNVSSFRDEAMKSAKDSLGRYPEEAFDVRALENAMKSAEDQTLHHHNSPFKVNAPFDVSPQAPDKDSLAKEWFQRFTSPSDFTGTPTGMKEKLPPIDPRVFCGAHTASECEACSQGHGKEWCNGDCEWRGDENLQDDELCKFRQDLVWCGLHAAAECRLCVWVETAEGYKKSGEEACRGECTWENGKCLLKAQPEGTGSLRWWRKSGDRKAPSRDAHDRDSHWAPGPAPVVVPKDPPHTGSASRGPGSWQWVADKHEDRSAQRRRHKKNAHPKKFEKSVKMGICARPAGGCDAADEIYTSVDCDGDGVRDHMCRLIHNSSIRLILSSEGCPSQWDDRMRPLQDCQAVGEESYKGVPPHDKTDSPHNKQVLQWLDSTTTEIPQAIGYQVPQAIGYQVPQAIGYQVPQSYGAPAPVAPQPPFQWSPPSSGSQPLVIPQQPMYTSQSAYSPQAAPPAYSPQAASSQAVESVQPGASEPWSPQPAYSPPAVSPQAVSSAAPGWPSKATASTASNEENINSQPDLSSSGTASSSAEQPSSSSSDVKKLPKAIEQQMHSASGSFSWPALPPQNSQGQAFKPPFADPIEHLPFTPDLAPQKPAYQQNVRSAFSPGTYQGRAPISDFVGRPVAFPGSFWPSFPPPPGTMYAPRSAGPWQGTPVVTNLQPVVLPPVPVAFPSQPMSSPPFQRVTQLQRNNGYSQALPVDLRISSPQAVHMREGLFDPHLKSHPNLSVSQEYVAEKPRKRVRASRKRSVMDGSNAGALEMSLHSEVDDGGGSTHKSPSTSAITLVRHDALANTEAHPAHVHRTKRNYTVGGRSDEGALGFVFDLAGKVVRIAQNRPVLFLIPVVCFSIVLWCALASYAVSYSITMANLRKTYSARTEFVHDRVDAPKVHSVTKTAKPSVAAPLATSAANTSLVDEATRDSLARQAVHVYSTTAPDQADNAMLRLPALSPTIPSREQHVEPALHSVSTQTELPNSMSFASGSANTGDEAAGGPPSVLIPTDGTACQEEP